jgi:hypothetical protein
MDNELKDLLVSGKEIDKKLVAEILKPYLRIDEETCDIRPLSTWADLKANVKILLYLIARKAMIALELPLSGESATATEIMEQTGMVKGTVNPALRNLFADRIIQQSDDKKYYIPNFAIEKIKEMVSQK